MVDLIPGTTLPLHVGPGGFQPEGRGEVTITEDRAPVPMVEGQWVDGVDPRTLEMVGRMIERYDSASKKTRKTIFAQASCVTDGTYGNGVAVLFTCPQGFDAHVTSVTVDAPFSTTINPSAPYANASSYAYLAFSASSTGDSGTNADNYRGGMVAFAPTSAAGPIIPGQWTFTESEAPVLQGNESLFFVVHGGSVAAIKSLSLRITYRIELVGANL